MKTKRFAAMAVFFVAVCWGTPGFGGGSGEVGPAGGSWYAVDPAHRELIHEASWIWWDRDVGAIESPVRRAPFTFTRVYEIDGEVERALLEVTADTQYKLSVNGSKLGKGDTWHELERWDLAPHLERGSNEIRIESTSTYRGSGLFVVGTVELADGETIEIVSDPSWKVRSERAEEVRNAEIVVREINGGYWNNTARRMRYPEAYYRLNTKVEAPGIAWARPWADKALRVLAVHPRSQQRDTVNLVHRSNMKVDAVFDALKLRKGGTTPLSADHRRGHQGGRDEETGSGTEG
jgi:hypothetical protein